MKKKNPLHKSFGYAARGILHVIKSERNMKIHIAISIMVILSGIILDISRIEFFVCFILIALVMSLEIVNTAIEAVTDIASPKYSKLAEISKDAAAGAVLLAAIVAAGIGLFIFIPALIDFLS